MNIFGIMLKGNLWILDLKKKKTTFSITESLRKSSVHVLNLLGQKMIT